MTRLSHNDNPPFRTQAEAVAHRREIRARLGRDVTMPVTSRTARNPGHGESQQADAFQGVVAGAPNMLALSAAKQFLAGAIEGPLYIWGPHGTGKTTLAQALTRAGAAVFDNVDIAPPIKVLRTHFPALVLTASRPPVALEHPELARMCMSAAVVAITPFDVTHARAVVARQLAAHQLLFPDFDMGSDLIDALASVVIDGHLSAGVIKGLLARHWLGEDVSRAALDACLASITEAHEPRISIRLVQSIVAARFGVSLHELVCRRRTQELVQPRQIAMALARRLTTHSLPEIGRRFDRDHTTVAHAVERVDVLERGDPDLRKVIAALEEKIRQAAARGDS